MSGDFRSRTAEGRPMTEAEWLACDDPEPMRYAVRETASNRKLRLFAILCCSRISYMLTDQRSRNALSQAERLAEGQMTQRERRNWYRTLRGYADDFAPDEAVTGTFHRSPHFAASEAAEWSAIAIGAAADMASSDVDHIRVGHQARDAEKLLQSQFLRDIFGNPFRPVAFDPAWLTETVVGIARGIYEDRAFERMPILADALQEAGCENADILAHCREPGVHVRGCWVVDLVLGKA
jgi:hypothetical protein